MILKCPMNIEELYDSVVLKLKKNERPLLRLSPELSLELKSKWQDIFLRLEQEKVPDKKLLTKILCILDNTQDASIEFNELFQQTFNQIEDPELLIYALGASQKHIVSYYLKNGEKIPTFYFEQLKVLLQNKNAEVKEWVLRTIDTLGPQSLPLKEAVRGARPGFKSLFNPHAKAASLIIDLLEKQWAKK